MNLKEQLKTLKEKILAKEEKEVLKSHPIGEQNIYRLHYINYHRTDEDHSLKRNNVALIAWPFTPFMLPDNMNREDALKVLSYLTDNIEKRDDVDSCSLYSLKILDGILNLKQFGFKRVKETDENKILDLFTINGDVSLFKKSKLYSKYFEWYKPDITLEDVETIYQSCGLRFKDVVWYEEIAKTKNLKK